MKKKELTGKERRVRTMLAWMPLVMAPLVTVLFWVAGGGRGRAAVMEITGFLKKLPAPYVDPITKLDKMGYYELARRDSLAERQHAAAENSLARQLHLEGPMTGTAAERPAWETTAKAARETTPDFRPAAQPLAVKLPAVGADSNVERIRQRLAELKEAVRSKRTREVEALEGPARSEKRQRDADAWQRMARPTEARQAPVLGRPVEASTPVIARSSPGLQRLELAMNALQHDDGPSTEMHELNAVVEKLLVLQRAAKDTATRTATPIVAVRPSPALRPALIVAALPDAEDTVGRFDSTRIEAVVPETTALVSGGELRLELVQDIQIGRQRVPAGTAVFGIVSLSGERLRVTTEAIASDGGIIPVSLDVVDEDGMTGIYIPGAPVTEAFRESAGQEVGAFGSGIASTTLAGQAAGAGVMLAKSLIGKKVRPMKVTIPAGYRVLLKVKSNGL